MRLWDSRSKGESTSAFSHDARICGISVVNELLISADTAEGFKIWDHRKGGEPRIETSMFANARITCMTAAPEMQKRPASSSIDETHAEDVAEEADNEENAQKVPQKGRNPSQPISAKGNGKQPRPEGNASQRKRKKRKLLS